MNDGCACVGAENCADASCARVRKYREATVKSLVEVCKSLIGIAEHYGPKPPDHICGPETCCDGDCVDWHYFAKAMDEARRVLETADHIVDLNKMVRAMLCHECAHFSDPWGKECDKCENKSSYQPKVAEPVNETDTSSKLVNTSEPSVKNRHIRPIYGTMLDESYENKEI